jgi:hypothetical protein
VSEKHIKEASYYHARTAEMMAKAQTASSKAIRVAYLNLARKWAGKAAALETQKGADMFHSDGVQKVTPQPSQDPGRTKPSL